MRLKGLILSAALGAIVGTPAFVPAASAQNSIYVPLFSYRTGAFAGSGIPIANGMSDYLNMLNERDGGIGGVKIAVEECETGYDTKKGVECYESTKGKNPVITNPYSTGITVDGLWSFGLGRRHQLPVGLQPARDLLGRPVDDHQVHRREGRRSR